MKNLFLFIVLCFTSIIVSGQKSSTVVDSLKEILPKFPGEEDAIYRYVYNNLHYPYEAKRRNITGNVVVQFVVGIEGEVRDIKVIRSLGYGCDEEAIRIVESMNDGYKWTPGSHHGHPVPVTFTLPIKFALK